MSFLRNTLGAVVCVFVLASAARAATISFTNTSVSTNGTGFGNVYSLLSLHATGQQTSEYGSVLWNGSNDVITGNAQPGAQTNTQPASIIQSATNASNVFGLIFNINQPGNNPSVVLNDFDLVFQNAQGVPLFTATYDAPAGGLNLTQIGNGTGAAGWLFHVNLTNGEAAQFFANPNNRLGQVITQANGITNVQGGPENFFLQNPGPTPPPPPIPEPASLALWSVIGVGALVLGTRKIRTSGGLPRVS